MYFINFKLGNYTISYQFPQLWCYEWALLVQGLHIFMICISLHNLVCWLSGAIAAWCNSVSICRSAIPCSNRPALIEDHKFPFKKNVFYVVLCKWIIHSKAQISGLTLLSTTRVTRLIQFSPLPFVQLVVQLWANLRHVHFLHFLCLVCHCIRSLFSS